MPSNGKQPAPSDEELARRAREKLAAGKRPLQREQRALDRLVKAKEETLRQQFYRSVPQKHYREMAGRQAKILYEQAQRTGIPFDRAEVDLRDVIRGFHDLLAAKKHLLWRPGDQIDEDSDVALLGETSPALEKWRNEKFLLARIERMERQGQLLPRTVVHTGMAELANVLRQFGKTLEKDFGREAAEMLTDALDEFDRIMGGLFDACEVEPDSELPEELREDAGPDDPDPPR